jgi:hypothetical protein
MQPPVSPAARLFGQLPQPYKESLVGFRETHLSWTIAQHRPQHFPLPTGTPFRALRCNTEYLYGLQQSLWAYHFFDNTALKPTMSGACSVTNCFSLRFSSSN